MFSDYLLESKRNNNSERTANILEGKQEPCKGKILKTILERSVEMLEVEIQ